MRIRLAACAASAALALSMSAAPAAAQQYESVGTRAQGMAGAFVAVADDSTATWWNPAGLASGAYYDTVLEYDTVQQPKELVTSHPVPAWQSKTKGVAFAYPAMGLSYYRLQISELRPFTSTAGGSSIRQDQGAAGVRLRSLLVNQYGVTLGQSLSKYVVIASTLKLLRGSVASSQVASADATFENALKLKAGAQTRLDLDVGLLAKVGILHVGGSIKNLRQPEFGPADDLQELKRQARVGVSVITKPQHGLDQLTLAADADLTTSSTVLGDTKNIAGGAEAWLLKKHVGVRAGVSTNTIGPRHWAPSTGASVALKTGSYIEGHYSAGSDQTRKGWGFDLRVTF